MPGSWRFNGQFAEDLWENWTRVDFVPVAENDPYAQIIHYMWPAGFDDLGRPNWAGTLSPRQPWMNTAADAMYGASIFYNSQVWTYSDDDMQRIACHEMGHGLGLHHEDGTGCMSIASSTYPEDQVPHMGNINYVNMLYAARYNANG
jgi:hypothetical protein